MTKIPELEYGKIVRVPPCARDVCCIQYVRGIWLVLLAINERVCLCNYIYGRDGNSTGVGLQTTLLAK